MTAARTAGPQADAPLPPDETDRLAGGALGLTSVLCCIVCLGFVLYDPSNDGALLKLGTWSPLLGVLGILGVQALVSIAIIRYFRTVARDGFHWWTTLVAPVLGFAAMAGACALLVVNRYDLAGAGDAVFITLLPWVVLAVFVAGLVLALVLRSRSPDRYARIGQFQIPETEGVAA